MFYKVVGIMSGTSLDGLDIVICDFSSNNGSYNFEIIASETVDFTRDLSKSLENARSLDGLGLIHLDLELGTFIGERVEDFLEKHNVHAQQINFIASHGHTVFHQPEKRITCQIGNGQEIARITGIPTISNFREKDVLFGGQGAPLVPIGDRDLFREKYKTDVFINLGGFANATFIHEDTIEAFDISPCNLVLNRYAKLLGYAYDTGGWLGRDAKNEHQSLVSTLNNLDYFSKKPPKSLGAEWLASNFYKFLDLDELSAQDKLGICYEVISDQIAKVLLEKNTSSALLTGGGAKNDYLIDLIRQKSKTEIILPNQDIVDFKEAVVFAYLGVLFMEGKNNSLREVTAAKESVCGGVLHKP